MTRLPILTIHERWRKWQVAAVALVGLLLAGLALPLVRTAIKRLNDLIAYPYATDGLEATLLSQAHLLWNGQQLYQPFERYHFVSSPYPPWHTLLLGLADQFVGPHPFWSGRMVSLVAGLLVLVTVIAAVRFAGRSWLAGLLAAVFLASAPPFVLWATRIKPDMYALLWTALGLLCAQHAINDQRRMTNDKEQDISSRRLLVVRHSSLVGAVLCFALAYFTKQTALVAPLAVGLALASNDLRNWFAESRDGSLRQLPLRPQTFGYAATYLILVGVPWLLLDLWSGGQFTFHVWTQHRGVLWTPQLMLRYVGLLADVWPMIVLAAGCVALAWREKPALVPAWYVLVAPLTLFGAGETGANHNHLLETSLALALAGGIVLGWAVRNLATRPMAASLVCALMCFQLLLVYTPLPWYGSELDPQETPERYIEFIRSMPGEVLADDPGLLYLAGKPLRYDDPSSFGPDASSNLWDQSGLLDDITNRRFSAILVPFNTETDTVDPTGRWTPEVIQAVREHYTLLYRDTTMVYIPK